LATNQEILSLIENLDKKWAGYLLALDELRQGVVFQALAGKKILPVYQEEAFRLFTQTFENLV
jgi:preprotein translocase subunit SecA